MRLLGLRRQRRGESVNIDEHPRRSPVEQREEVEYGWQRLLCHHGYVEVRLTLDDAAKPAVIQSGYHAAWAGEGIATQSSAPLVLVDATRVLRGESARARLYPLMATQWVHVAPGAQLRLMRGTRRIGSAVVDSVVDLPSEPESRQFRA